MHALETLDDILLSSLHQYADDKAYCQGDRVLTRSCLHENSNGLAELLMRLSLSAGAPVPIFLNKSLEFIISIFGVLKSGAMFVPLDIYDAPDRLQYILNDLAAPVIITDAEHLPLIKGHYLENSGVTVLLVENLGAYSAMSLSLQFMTIDGKQISEPTAVLPPRRHNARSQAYIIYTSGSTGRPKGVVVRHESLVNYIKETVRMLKFDANTRIMCVKSFSYDASLTDIFCPLHSGGYVYLIDQKHITPRTLDRGIRDFKLTHLSCTPSVLKLLVTFSDLTPSDFESLESITFGGEAISAAILQILQRKLPRLKLFNRYGPTEATVVAATYEVTSLLSPSDMIPIGKAHLGVSLFAFGENGTPLCAGESGELLIGGVQLMEGYWGDPELSAQSMYFDKRAGMNVYHTGDLVTIDEEGNYVYLGRIDQTINKYGIRINLHEIENAIKAIDGVHDCITIYLHADDEQTIVAYVKGDELSARMLKTALQNQLPQYMIPDTFEFVANFPITSSGKPDREGMKRAYQSKE